MKKEECKKKERDKRDDEAGNKKCGECYTACLEGKENDKCRPPTSKPPMPAWRTRG